MTTPVKIDAQDQFKITNMDDRVIKLQWARRRWTLEPSPQGLGHPGMAAIVPFDVVRLYFGDPRTTPGAKRKVRDSLGEYEIPGREIEIERLANMYGLYQQGMADLANARWPTAEELAGLIANGEFPARHSKDDDANAGKFRIPRVRIETMEGVEIVPVAFDPDGTQASSFTESFGGQDGNAAAQISLLRERLARLERLEEDRINRQAQPGEDEIMRDGEETPIHA
jgi:hypothetical protein